MTQTNTLLPADTPNAEPPVGLPLAADRVDPHTGAELAPLDTQLAELDQAIALYSIDKLGVAGTFSHAFKLAAGMNEIDRLITDEMMGTIMPLMNTRLGFKTDRDPSRWNKKANDGKGGYVQPYEQPIVKRCLIEATLRGAYPVNNEFNIIAGGPYLTKEFYQRKVKDFPGVTDLQEIYGVPKKINGVLCVEAVAKWKLNGVQQALERTGENAIAIIADEYSNADQSQGKAARKLLYAVYRRLTGSESSTAIDPNDPDVIDGTLKQQAIAQDIDDVQRHPDDDGRQEDPNTDYAQAPANGPGSDVDPWAVLESRYANCFTQPDVAKTTAAFRKEFPHLAKADQDKLKTLDQVHQKRVRAQKKG